MNIDLVGGEFLERVIKQMLDVWPQHQVSLIKNFTDCSLEDRQFLNSIAECICTITGGKLRDACLDYKWTCERLLEAICSS